MAPKNKKKRENYFQQNINNSGENFLESMPLDKMVRDTVRVFRELARGDIDIDKYGKYFFNKRFLHACIDSARRNYTDYAYSAKGLYDLIFKCIDEEERNYVHSLSISHSATSNAYKLIMESLQSFDYYGDINILKNLVYVLPKYRNDIK